MQPAESVPPAGGASSAAAAPNAGGSTPLAGMFTMEDVEIAVQRGVAAALSNASSGSVVTIANAVAQRLRQDAEAAVLAAKKAATMSMAKRVQGETFQALADVNGFTLEAGDDPADPLELVCVACSRYASITNRPKAIACNGKVYKVKERITKHQNSKVHKNAYKKHAAMLEREHASRQTGMVIARTAYFQIREGGSYLGFERQIGLAHLNSGVNLGTMHHSEKFCRDMVPHFAAVLAEDMASFLGSGQELLGGERPVVALNADKATTKGRTGHIVGALAFDPARGEIIGMLLADSVVAEGDSDAAGLTEAIMQAVKKFIPNEADCKQQVWSRAAL